MTQLHFGAGAARAGHFEGEGPARVTRARWKFQTTSHAYIRNTPAIADGVLFASYDNELLHAVDLAKGKPLWSVAVGGARRESISNPLVAHGLLFVVGGDACRAIDLQSRTTRWTLALARESTASPVVVGEDLIVGSASGEVVAVAALTGQPRWRFQAPAGEWIQSALAATEDLVVMGTQRTTEHGLVIALERSTGRARWTAEAGAMSHSGAPAIVGDTVFALTGMGQRLIALDLTSGQQRWNHTGPGALWGAPAAAAGIVCYTGDRGRLEAVDAATGRARWSAELGAAPRSTVSPAIAGGIVYLGVGREVRSWTLADGAARETWRVPYTVTTAPLIADGSLYVGCDQVIVAFGAAQRAAAPAPKPSAAKKPSAAIRARAPTRSSVSSAAEERQDRLAVGQRSSPDLPPSWSGPWRRGLASRCELPGRRTS